MSGDEPTAIEDLSLEDMLSESVVTGNSGRAESRALTAANVFQVTREQIRVHGWRSLTEILSNVPGLYVVDDLVDPSVSVRGVTGGINAGTRIIKLLINGVAVSFRPTLHAPLGPEFIPVAAIERVEIAKGPLSALYGANAFMATINVITRQATQGSGGEAMAYGTLIRDGRPGVGGNMLVTSGNDKLDFVAAIGGEHVDRSGLRVRKTFAAQNPDIARYQGIFDGESKNDIARPSSVFVQGVAKVADGHKLTLQGGLQNHDYMGEFQPESTLTHNSRYAISNFWSNLRYDGQVTRRLQSWAAAGYSRGGSTTDEALFVTQVPGFAYRREASYNAVDASAGVRYTLLYDFILTGGVDATYEMHVLPHYQEELRQAQGALQPGTTLTLAPPGARLKRDIDNVGPYVAANGAPFKALPNLRIAANARLDLPSLFHAQYSWRAAIAYAFTSTLAAKIIAGRAYQTPSMDLLFGNSGFGSSYNVFGARTLGASVKPQVIESVEAVLSASLHGLVSDLSVFAQHVAAPISFIPEDQQFVAGNGDTLQNGGIEANVRGTFDWLQPYVSGSVLMWSRPSSDGGHQLSFQPPPLYPNYFLLAGATASWQRVPLTANVHARIVGKRGSSDGNTRLNNGDAYTLGAYATVDASLMTHDVHFAGSRETTFVLTVRNIADTRWSEPGYGGFDLPSNGRTIFLSVRQEL